MLYNIARSISELHASGFVHRDIQPSNVIWLPRENRWSVISFRRTAPAGESARVRYSLAYAAPEAISADVNGRRSMTVTPALDAWSLGVLAIELFTGTAVFDAALSDHEVRVCSVHAPDAITLYAEAMLGSITLWLWLSVSRILQGLCQLVLLTVPPITTRSICTHR